jgi:alcohol dehydrogenase
VADNAADGWRAIDENLVDPSTSRVLIIGGGLRSIGLYAVAAARALGVAEVHYVDRNPDRLSRADRLGATTLERSRVKRLGAFDLTIDASQSEEGLLSALASTRRGGTCQCVSLYYQDKFALPLIQMYADGVTFRIGRANVRPAIPKVLAAIATGKMRADLVISQVASWADAISALLGGTTSKMVITRT